MKHKSIIILLIFYFLPFFYAWGNNSPSMVFLNPGGREDIFFKLMTTFMQAAADDLGARLEVIYCERNHIKLAREGKKLLERSPLPEYLLLINEKNGVANILPIADQKGIKIFLFNEGLLPDTRHKHGKPGEIYKNFLAEYLPDDFQAGYLLAKNLIEHALKTGMADKKGTLNIAGISGTFMTGSSAQRVDGLKKALSEYPNVTLSQIAPGHWETRKAKDITLGFLRRYPDVKVFWTASDGMALGVAQGVEAIGLKPGKDILTGGIDWADFAIGKVKDGTFSCSVGGHFMDGAWALIMLFDYHYGYSLANAPQKSSFSVLTHKNVGVYQNRFQNMDWSVIDFTKFSKAKNPQLKTYRFGLEPIMEQLKEQ